MAWRPGVVPAPATRAARLGGCTCPAWQGPRAPYYRYDYKVYRLAPGCPWHGTGTNWHPPLP